MQVQYDVELKNKTTFHIGGKAKKFFIPSSEKELSELFKSKPNDYFLILSGGSNLLINDKKEFDNVIYMKDIDKNFIQIKDNLFYIGASLRIQEVINRINELNYGGIEELYSLPAMFGGVVYMNAGIGGKTNAKFTISDFICRVKIFNIENKKIEWINKEDCDYSHRHSIFFNNKYIILGAECKFNEQLKEKSKEIIKARIEQCRKKQEIGNGAFGTCFSTANGRLLKIVSMIIRKKGNVRFAKNNSNWLVNEGNGTYKDTIYLINKCVLAHKLFHQKIECEVKIWN